LSYFYGRDWAINRRGVKRTITFDKLSLSLSLHSNSPNTLSLSSLFVAVKQQQPKAAAA